VQLRIPSAGYVKKLCPPVGHVFIVLNTLYQEWKCIRSNVTHGIRAFLQGYVGTERLSVFSQPLTQLLPLIFWLYALHLSRPKHNHAEPGQNTGSQKDEQPSSPHGSVIPKFPRTQKSFCLHLFVTFHIASSNPFDRPDPYKSCNSLLSQGLLVPHLFRG
jgi:hypothetical protein